MMIRWVAHLEWKGHCLEIVQQNAWHRYELHNKRRWPTGDNLSGITSHFVMQTSQIALHMPVCSSSLQHFSTF